MQKSQAPAPARHSSNDSDQQTSLEDATIYPAQQSSNNIKQDDVIVTDVRSEQIRIIFSATPSSLFTILIISLVLSTALLGIIDHSHIIGWFLATNVLSLYRLYLYRQFKRNEISNRSEDYWYRMSLIVVVLSGAGWGAAGIWLFAEHSFNHQLFLTFAIGGMCAGAATTLSAILMAGYAFVLLAISPVVLQFLLMDSDISDSMTLMLGLFLVMILVSVKRLNQTILSNINHSLTQRYQRKLAEKTIRYQTFHDDLTKLPNRRSILEKLSQELKREPQGRNYGAVIFIDLDGFKPVNNSLGYHVGDNLLIQVAKRLRSELGLEDMVGRNNGDEFIILQNINKTDIEQTEAQACHMANKLRKAFEVPFTVFEHQIHISVSIGITLLNGNSENAEDLLECAKVAMNHAKSEGRNNMRLFDKSLREAVNQRQSIEMELSYAVENNELELYFQPQFNKSERLIGAEALLRWNHPVKGMVPPGLFIEMAEQTGLIIPIGNWVIRRACECLRQIEDNPGLTISVNVSAYQFRNSQFIDQVRSMLRETGANPHRLKLEITETMMINDIDQTIDAMKRLKEIGIGFSVDDFGTGYSSLAYLNRLPIDELKIDQAFVRNIHHSPENAAIVIAIINMAKHLKLDIIAEGVETRAEIEFLKKAGCHRFQGYYFEYPQPFEQFQRLVSGTDNKISSLAI